MKKVVLVMVGLLAVLAFLAGCAERETAVVGEAVYGGANAARQAVNLGRLNAAVIFNEDTVGVNCDTICINNRRTCVGAFIGIDHDMAEFGDPSTEIIREWNPVTCRDERETNPIRCLCY